MCGRGIAIALAEACISGKLGAEVQLQLNRREDEMLFGEAAGRILVSISPTQQAAWENYLHQNLGDDWQKIGVVGNIDQSLRVSTHGDRTLIDARIEVMSDRFYNAIERRLDNVPS